MELELYLEELRNCKDELVKVPGQSILVPRLTAEYGTYDNYSVLYQGKDKTIVKKLLDSEAYRYGRSIKSGHSGWVLIHKPSGNMTQIFRQPVDKQSLMWYSTGGLYWANGMPVEQSAVEEGERQLRDYNGLIVLNDNPEIKGNVVREARLMVSQIEDLVNCLQKHEIPFCMPKSHGLAYKDYSRIVYWKPEPGQETGVK